MNDFLKGRALRFVAVVVIALAPNSVLIAADDPDEARAIRDIVLLGGDVGHVHGHVTSVIFRKGNDFRDDDIRLLRPFTKLEMLNLKVTLIAGARINGSGLNELNRLKDLNTLSLR